MAAGEGRRLRPLTERWPKPVLPIDGRPVLATLLHELARMPAARVFLVTGHLREQVERLAGDGSAFGVDVRLVHQPGVLGSADAVQRAADQGAFGVRTEQIVKAFPGRPRSAMLSGIALFHSAGHIGEAATGRTAGGFGTGV